MKTESEKQHVPMILAPAGSRASFLAAVAARADAVYCGLKQFSARMEAKNFTIEELDALIRLAHDKGTRVYVAVNTLLKPGELDHAGGIIQTLGRIKPDALILQDLAMVKLVRQAGFSGQLNLSTLTNVTFPDALKWVRTELGVDRVVLPRELDVDEIKSMAAACPEGLSLEAFVHGALCYGVSGRCYWSSYMGGKSGLRGRCVQPCRRVYTQKERRQRMFSCMDLSLDVLVKVLRKIPQVQAWKIEGRKKGPHYVYYTVRAYQTLRDHGGDPQAKKTALQLLAMALGREGTHYHFLPQRPQIPIAREGRNTGSGLYVGSVQGGGRKTYLTPSEALLAGDVLRLGYEDVPGHAIHRVGRAVPKKGRLYLTASSRRASSKSLPVFLIDRREKALGDMIAQLEGDLSDFPMSPPASSSFRARLGRRSFSQKTSMAVSIRRRPSGRATGERTGYWLGDDTREMILSGAGRRSWWCLPPVLWPKRIASYRQLVAAALEQGSRHFILNAPWQMSLFPKSDVLHLWAGPFCNLSNPLAIDSLADAGFAGAIVSPELSGDDYFQLPQHSCLPLGIVIAGNWPLCVSRTLSESVAPELPFTSPKGEQAWVRRYDDTLWVFPNWPIDISAKKNALEKAGYRLFVSFQEPLPRGVTLKIRPGLWNWEMGLG